MNYRISRNDQEYGPYTIEEIVQYVDEGSILLTDYAFNGMEWIPVSQLLDDPQKIIARTQKASFNYNTSQESNSQEIEKGRPKLSKNIFGVIVFLGIAGFYFLQNRNGDEIEKFHNSLVQLNTDFIEEFTNSENFISQEGRDKLIYKANDTLIEIDELVVAPGKKGLGYELKDSVVEMIQLVISMVEEISILGEGGSLDEAVFLIEFANKFEPQFEKLTNQFEKIQKEYAANNNMELLH